MGRRTARTWRVGELARTAGLTVRTLHHYDHAGLVRPSRSSAGHRLYTTEDVERLYRVLALRQLGLPLEEISEVVEGATSLVPLLTEHAAHLDRRLTAIRALRTRVAGVLATAGAVDGADGRHVGVDELLDLVRKVVAVDDTVKQYFSDEQLARLDARRDEVGEQAIADVQQRWPALVHRVQQALDDGTDPTSAHGRELAREWHELLRAFHGGDEGLRDSLYRMHEEQGDRIRTEYGGPDEAQLEFIARASRG